MKIFITLFILLLVSSFTVRKPCEVIVHEGQSTITTIYPICGDTTMYIRRSNYHNGSGKEECFKNGQIYSLINFECHAGSSELNYEEFTYINGSLYELKEYLLTAYNVMYKNFRINDSTDFVLNYYKNGSIKRYGLIRGDCPFGRTVELDSLDDYRWIGERDPTERIDSVWQKESRTDSVLIQTVVCGLKKGKWTKYDNTNKAIDSVVYVNGEIKKIANIK